MIQRGIQAETYRSEFHFDENYIAYRFGRRRELQRNWPHLSLHLFVQTLLQMRHSVTEDLDYCTRQLRLPMQRAESCLPWNDLVRTRRVSNLLGHASEFPECFPGQTRRERNLDLRPLRLQNHYHHLLSADHCQLKSDRYSDQSGRSEPRLVHLPAPLELQILQIPQLYDFADPRRRHSTLGQISPPESERRQNQQGVDPMEKPHRPRFPTGYAPTVSFNKRKTDHENDQLSETLQ